MSTTFDVLITFEIEEIRGRARDVNSKALDTSRGIGKLRTILCVRSVGGKETKPGPKVTTARSSIEQPPKIY